MKTFFAALVFIASINSAHAESIGCTYKFNGFEGAVNWNPASRAAQHRGIYSQIFKGRVNFTEEENTWGGVSLYFPNQENAKTVGGWTEVKEYEITIFPAMPSRNLFDGPPRIVNVTYTVIGSIRFATTAMETREAKCSRLLS